MHDANGTPLQVGDRVMIPGVVTQVSPGSDYCNVTVETQLGRRPDGAKDRFSAINTAQLVLFSRENPGSVPLAPPGMDAAQRRHDGEQGKTA